MLFNIEYNGIGGRPTELGRYLAQRSASSSATYKSIGYCVNITGGFGQNDTNF